ncbi:hypothetical protein Tco_0057119 [Tanacetum coccineum]
MMLNLGLNGGFCYFKDSILKSKIKREQKIWPRITFIGYADYINYLVGKVVPPKWTSERRKRFYSQVKNYLWDEYALKLLCPDNIMRRCVAGSDTCQRS